MPFEERGSLLLIYKFWVNVLWGQHGRVCSMGCLNRHEMTLSFLPTAHLGRGLIPLRLPIRVTNLMSHLIPAHQENCQKKRSYHYSSSPLSFSLHFCSLINHMVSLASSFLFFTYSCKDIPWHYHETSTVWFLFVNSTNSRIKLSAACRGSCLAVFGTKRVLHFAVSQELHFFRLL